VGRDEWRRYAAPAGFLLLVTIAVILIHAGLEAGGDSANTQPPVPPPPTTRVETTAATTTTKTRTRTAGPARRYWTVRAGDTFGVISRATGVSLATIEQLNPGLSSTSLTIGEKVRVR
jgi:LysM repeat protein